jgi:hypothetical protein
MGGLHAHDVVQGDGLAVGGPHAHTFVIDGQPVTTLPGGEHAHPVISGELALSSGPHSHDVMMPDGAVLMTRMGGPHDHLPDGSLSGLHHHELEVSGALITSDTPAPERRPVAQVLGPAAKALGPLDVDPAGLRLLGDGEVVALDAQLHAAAERLA